MILAGIDEAGYGPLLGPLVVGCSAWEIPAEAGEGLLGGELPCLWTILRKLVSRTRSRSGRKIHVNDSKQVYSSSAGLRELERSLLAIVTAGGEWPGDLEALLEVVSPAVMSHMPEYGWYEKPANEVFPLDNEAMPVKLFANALRAEMARTAVRCVHLNANVMLERQLNHMMNQTQNKASALFSISAGHIDHLLRTYGHQNLTIFCDRQGGREHYGSLLRLMFEEWSLSIIKEIDGHSEYQLHNAGHSVRILFCEKAEAQCLPVALASMLAKYLREAMMRRFNTWWRMHQPGLSPTAGYHTDGVRFLKDIDAKRRELGVTDDLIIRAR